MLSDISLLCGGRELIFVSAQELQFVNLISKRRINVIGKEYIINFWNFQIEILVACYIFFLSKTGSSRIAKLQLIFMKTAKVPVNKFQYLR
jgi:hypothetical protein